MATSPPPGYRIQSFRYPVWSWSYREGIPIFILRNQAATAGSLALPETMPQGRPLTKALRCLGWNILEGQPSIAWLDRETQRPLPFHDPISRRGALILALVV